jgi:hypothetical protein
MRNQRLRCKPVAPIGSYRRLTTGEIALAPKAKRVKRNKVAVRRPRAVPRIADQTPYRAGYHEHGTPARREGAVRPGRRTRWVAPTLVLLSLPMTCALLLGNEHSRAEAAAVSDAPVLGLTADPPAKMRAIRQQSAPSRGATAVPAGRAPHALLDAIEPRQRTDGDERVPANDSLPRAYENAAYACRDATDHWACPFTGAQPRAVVQQAGERGQWLCVQYCVATTPSSELRESGSDVLEGPFRATYLRSSRVAAQGMFRDGRAEGLWRFFSPRGVLTHVGHLQAGHAHGVWFEYRSDDAEPTRSRWNHGLRTGG